MPACRSPFALVLGFVAAPPEVRAYHRTVARYDGIADWYDTEFLVALLARR